jgi:creatinine amidohydrolase
MSSRAPASPIRMDELTWPEFERHVEHRGVVILPVGSTEQHGRHLPLGTDSLIAIRLAELVAAEIGAVVAPALNYGFRSQPDTGGGEAFPGSVGVTGSAVSSMIADVLGSLLDGGCRRVIVLSAHYENAWFITDGVERALAVPGRDAARVLVSRWAPFVSPDTLALIGGGGAVDWAREHAGVAETSLMLALADGEVGDSVGSRVAPPSTPYQAFPQVAERPDHDGLLSSADGASAEIGEAIIRDVIRGLTITAEIEFGAGSRA